MSDRLLIIREVRIIDPARRMDQVGDLLVRDGGIQYCGAALPNVPEEAHVVEARGWVACPAFIDLHCHLREPGYEDKETIATGTRAAARGGFGTVCCMPNTEPPLDCSAAVEFVLHQAIQTGHVRVVPIGCVSRGRQGRELAELAELMEVGVAGFSDDGAPVADAHLMRMALTYLRGHDVPIIDHCEDPAISRGGVMNEGWVSTRLGLRGQPGAAEEAMIARDITLAELTGGRLHLAHISTARGVELVRQAKERGLAVTAEATPHHLTMTDQLVLGLREFGGAALSLDAYDTRCKVNPPLRTRADVDALVQGLSVGVIDAVATDHAPHTVMDKQATFDEAASGISGLETALGSLLGLVHTGRLDLPTLVYRLTVGPSMAVGGRFARLTTLQEGTPADVVVFDPAEEWKVDVAQFVSKGKNTPMDGVTVKGRVKMTLVEGRLVYDGMLKGAAK